MTMSINNSSMAYIPLDTDKKRARAEAFINKNDKEITTIASRAVSIRNHKDNEKLGKNLQRTFNAIPVLAAASALALGKGVKPALKTGADWGLAVAMPSVIVGLNKQAMKNDSVKSAEKKHAGMSFGAQIVATLAGYWGASALLDKASKNPTVNKVADAMITGVKDTFGKIKKEVKLPEKVTKVASKVTEKAQQYFDKAMTKDIGKKAFEGGKKAGKFALKNAPMLALAGILGAAVVSAMKRSSEVAATKNMIKKDQLKTAQVLVNTYKQENADLKSQLAEQAE